MLKLQKLKYLRAGIIPYDENKISINKTYILEQLNVFCSQHCACKGFHDKEDVENSLASFCLIVDIWLGGFDPYGVKAPRGVGKLEALHTLGVVNVARGKHILKDLKKLTHLRKLGVTGINKENDKELCYTIAGYRHLQSLSMRAEGADGQVLAKCFDGKHPPPQGLKSLKLFVKLVNLPEWIKTLENLTKLTLRSTQLKCDALQVLGDELPFLSTLRIWKGAFEEGKNLLFKGKTYKNLVSLELCCLDNLPSVEFEREALPGLSTLQVEDCWPKFSGIENLSKLKEVSIKGCTFQVYWKEFHSTEKSAMEDLEELNKFKDNLVQQINGLSRRVILKIH